MSSDEDDINRPIIDYSEPPDPSDAPAHPSNALTWWPWIAYGQGHVLNDLCASMWFTYLLVYLEKCVHLSHGPAGYLLLIGQIADAVATPLIGIVSDKGSSAWYCKLGRRKTWHIAGTCFVILSFPLIFSPRLKVFQFLDDSLHMVYYIPFVVLFQFGWAAVQIAHLSLVPDLTPDDVERTSLLSLRYAFTVISNLVVYAIMYFAIGETDVNDKIGPEDVEKFQFIAYCVIVVGSISTLVFYAGVSEASTLRREEDEHNRLGSGVPSSRIYLDEKTSPWQLLKMSSLYIIGVLYMTARLFFNILQMFIVFYVTDTLKLSKINIALVPLVILLSGFATSLIIKPLNVRYGRKISHFIGLILGVFVSLVVLLEPPSATVLLMTYGVAILYGISSTVIQVTSFGMAADFVGDDINNGAFIYGILSFADKTSNGVVGCLIQVFKRQGGDYYQKALGYGCGLPCIIGILALLFLPSTQIRTRTPTISSNTPTGARSSLSSNDELHH